MTRILAFLWLTAILPAFAPAQPNGNNSSIAIHNRDFVYNAKKMVSDISLDGVLDEPDWQLAQKADGFFLVLPIDTGKAGQPSEIMLTYDDKSLYMAVTFFDTVPGKRIAESFRRDFVFGNNDNFLVFFDTYLDQTNGFTFGVSAAGAVWDGVMYDGSKVNLNWDCKMETKVRHYDDRWVAEMRVPFRAMRYPKGSRRWYVNFSRQDLKTNEKSAWAPVPRQFPTASLAYTGVLNFESDLPEPSLNLSVIPYIYGSYHRDTENGRGEGYRKDVGFDAKVGISSSMNLDLTYNPDFAQVEVDQQQMNVDRFELFYPEKRQFFLENSDLFSGFGYSTVTPFFSRRIGLDAPVLAGARLSGKIGHNWRVGFMNMTTAKTDEHLSRNFSVFSLQRKMFSRSNIGFVFVNKEYLAQPDSGGLFNRVAGLDYNLASGNNYWSGKFFYHRSFQPGNPDSQFAAGAMLDYNRKNIAARVSHTNVGNNYKAETGFYRRKDYMFFGPEIAYLFIPNRKVLSHGPFVEVDLYFNREFEKNEHENSYGYKMELSNRVTLSAGMKDNFVKLLHDFDPTHVSGKYLPAGSGYRMKFAFAEFASDNRKLLKINATLTSGEFFGGHMNFATGGIAYRYPPYANLTMNFTYSDIILPEPFVRTKFWLLGPKLDLTFTEKLFLSSFVQYNEQLDNLNVNIRFQWRYQPVSDLFVVYTDNYFPETGVSRNRALVLKLTYWLN